MSGTTRCYWWPLTDEGRNKMGLNTNNIKPELLRFVDRKFDYSILKVPLKEKRRAHVDDQAEY